MLVWLSQMICSDLPLRGILTGIFVRKYTSSFSPIVVSRICLKQAIPPIPPLFPCSTTVYKTAPDLFSLLISEPARDSKQGRSRKLVCLSPERITQASLLGQGH